MEAMAEPTSHRCEVEMAENQHSGSFRPFGDALELYRRALSAAYLTALALDQRRNVFGRRS